MPDKQQPLDANPDKWADKQIFTTGEAAEVCNVSQQTIIRCFDAGRLTGFRVPGSKFRRIPRAELLRFMRENDIPTETLEGALKRVLVIDDEPEILQLFKDLLNGDRYLVETASTGYDAGLLTESFKPHLIVLDYMLPDINGDMVCQRIRQHPDRKDTKILFVSGVVEPKEVERLMRCGGDAFLQKPFDIDQLEARIEGLLEA